MLEGMVKWFNNPKGYGFIQAQESTEDQDVLIHYSVIEMEGFKTLKAGQTIQFEFSQGPKGLIATKVIPKFTESDLTIQSEIRETLIM